MLRTLAAFVLIAGTWWSMAEVSWSSDLIQTHVLKTFAEPPFHAREESGGFIVDHHVSACCEDLQNARVLAIWGTWLGGMPMAGLAFVVWRRYRDRSLKAIAEPFLLAALVFQFAAMSLALLFLSLFLPYAANDDLWAMLFLLSTALTSGLAIPTWYRLRLRVVPSEPLLNIL